MDTIVDPVNSGPGLLASLWRYRLLVAAITLLLGAGGYALSLLQPTLYQGEARLILADPRGRNVFQQDQAPWLADPSRYVRNRAEMMTSDPVLRRAASDLGRSDLGLIRARVSADPSADLDLVTVHALDPTPAGAAALANGVAKAFQAIAANQAKVNTATITKQLKDSKAHLQARIDDLGKRLQGAPDDAALRAERDAALEQLTATQSRADEIAVDMSLAASGVDWFEPANPPAAPAQPHSLGAGLAGAMVGLLAGGVFAWWLSGRTQTADGRQDAAPILKASLLGEVPDFASVGITGSAPALSAPKSAAGEAYQFVVASLEFALTESGGKTVLVTSPGPTDGKTVTALNLAIAARRNGRKVLLVDADARARGLTQLTDVPATPGLTELVEQRGSFYDCVTSVRISDEDALPIIPAGSMPSEPVGFFRTAAFRKALLQLREHADLVIIDSAPLLAVADTSAIASHTDGILVVVARGTRLHAVEEVRERLQFVGSPVLGYVFNRADLRRGRYGYGKYGYGKYGYGYGEQAEPAGAGSRPAGRGRRKVLS